MQLLFRTYRYINILSLDIAAGAVVCALFFARVLDVRLKISGLIALGLTVWVIYTVDHLLDARKISQPASTERHRFHQRNFRVLFFILMMMMVIDGIQLFFIRQPVIVAGVVLAGLVFVYFLAQRYLIYVKELCGALLYTGGVVLAPLALAVHSLSLVHVLLIVAFMLTALINLLLFTWFDREHDLQDKHQSFTIIFGEKATQNILSILFVINASLSVLLIKDDVVKPAIIVIAMNSILLFILLNKNFFSVGDRYRLLGDAVFLLPVIYFFI